jgi:uncharacterized membrane protein YedE/YeeE
MEWLQGKWSPYIVGACIGVLSWCAFLLSNRPIGCSTAFVRVVGLIERALLGKKTMEKPYYRRFVPSVDWEVMLLIGLGIGSLTSALISGTFRFEWVSSLWEASFGPSAGLRWIVALAGGVLVAIGARWAEGCTSGHSISGGLQLADSSWLATLCFFASGVATALLIHRVF